MKCMRAFAQSLRVFGYPLGARATSVGRVVQVGNLKILKGAAGGERGRETRERGREREGVV